MKVLSSNARMMVSFGMIVPMLKMYGLFVQKMYGRNLIACTGFGNLDNYNSYTDLGSLKSYVQINF